MGFGSVKVEGIKLESFAFLLEKVRQSGEIWVGRKRMYMIKEAIRGFLRI